MQTKNPSKQKKRRNQGQKKKDESHELTQSNTNKATNLKLEQEKETPSEE